MTRALVMRSAWNIFTVREIGEDGRPARDAAETECRLKGKRLKDTECYYNPLAPGDVVRTEDGLITELEPRHGTFARFNQKGQKPQLLAANTDLVLVVTSPVSPPFRPRFIDRALFEAELAGIPALIVVNKWDLCLDPGYAGDSDGDFEKRLADFAQIGYSVLRISAKTGVGLDDLRGRIGGRTVVLVGQSGVGKSSLLKALCPGLNLKIGAINEKWDRGNHTTTQGSLYLTDGAGMVIDTPGIRRFAPERVDPGEVVYYLPEFAQLAGQCEFGLSCRHEREKGCKILAAVESGLISPERYDTYLRLRDEMEGNDKYPDYD